MQATSDLLPIAAPRAQVAGETGHSSMPRGVAGPCGVAARWSAIRRCAAPCGRDSSEPQDLLARLRGRSALGEDTEPSWAWSVQPPSWHWMTSSAESRVARRVRLRQGEQRAATVGPRRWPGWPRWLPRPMARRIQQRSQSTPRSRRVCRSETRAGERSMRMLSQSAGTVETTGRADVVRTRSARCRPRPMASSPSE